MKILNQLGKAVQGSGNLVQNYVKDYIAIDQQSKQLILKPKAVLSLCQQVTAKIEQMTSLEPDANEGLLALVEHQQIKVKVHFTPENIVFNGEGVEDQLRLLNRPQFETDSLIYRSLILSWQVFLGGYIPNQALPEEVWVENDKIYYKFPKAQLRLIEALFHNFEEGSSLDLTLKRGELRVQSAVAIDWSSLNLQALVQIFSASFLSKKKD